MGKKKTVERKIKAITEALSNNEERLFIYGALYGSGAIARNLKGTGVDLSASWNGVMFTEKDLRVLGDRKTFHRLVNEASGISIDID